jgi:hypothetical protein
MTVAPHARLRVRPTGAAYLVDILVRILIGMPMTTIKVRDEVRDALAAEAHSRGISLGALLAEIARSLNQERRWAEIEDAYARLRQSPDGWSEYQGELASWEGAGESDPAAREEWPEYNQ